MTRDTGEQGNRRNGALKMMLNTRDRRLVRLFGEVAAAPAAKADVPGAVDPILASRPDKAPLMLRS